jgi:polysaccharide export outer membrane protein
MKKDHLRIVVAAVILLFMVLPAWAQPQGQKDIAPAQKPPEQKDASPARTVQGAVATDSDQYIIGPEDVLFINVWREESLSKTVPVRMDGKISLPLVDDVQASDLTPLQLKDVLTKKMQKVIDNPTVSVTVMEANSFKVYVSGQVKNPGAHRLRSETSFVQLMIIAGGFTDWANQKKILIIRKEAGKDKRITVNYKKIIEGDEPDIAIKRGDTVIIP